MLKGGKHAKKVLDNAPKAGTKTRLIYDALVNNAGKPVELPKVKYIGGILNSLMLYYALDIRTLRRGSRYQTTLYLLAGYHDGDKYIDFMAP
jgi:hypothetical protein